MARAGDVVGGKYRLIHPLGIGGMGTVWRAEHVALKQLVAIKLLNVRGGNVDRTVKRFQREAQIAASVRHRNIVYISDFGSDSHEPYIVMELLSGVPLSERMVVGEPLGVVTFLNLMDETLQGLSAVHAAGVVHRDMKPENIFLVRNPDGTMFPKLLDFGVSRSTARGQGHTITREGVVMGTPEYVSPEQARGKMADTRSDIYSLGALMFEALAGRLPFHADNAADLIVAVLNAPQIPLMTFRPELGQALSDLVAKALDREPAKRFQTAEEMRSAIAALVAAEPELAAHSLPRRFLTPSQQRTSDDNEETEPDASLTPTVARLLSEPGAPTRAIVPGMARARVRWIMLGIALLALAGSVFVSGGASNARAPMRAESGARTAASVSAPALQPAGAPAPASEVLVELFGVPEGATVRADGVPVEGTSLRFSRDSGPREITVEAPDHESWRVLHDSSRDGRYAISMAQLPEKKPLKPARSAHTAKGASKGGSGLLRRPDF